MTTSANFFLLGAGGFHWRGGAAPLVVLCWSGISMLLFAVSGCRPGDKPDATARPKTPAAASPTPRTYLGSEENSPLPQTGGTDPGWLVDATSSSGVQFRYRTGIEGKQFTILETVGGGVALIDFDLDGDLDLLFPGGGSLSAPSSPSGPVSIVGHPFALFRNDGQGHFADVSSLIEMSAIAGDDERKAEPRGSSSPAFYSHGAFVSDFDRDGDPDVLVTGYRGCALLRNEQGQRFVDISATSGISLSDWSTAAAWADVNRDGWPDLLLISYLEWDGKPDETCGDLKHQIRDACPPSKFAPGKQRLFLNRQDGTFAEVQNAFEGPATGKGLGVVAADLNADGWVDFYVANDGTPNHLYLGGPQFPLTEVGVLSSTSGNEFGLAEGSMGVDAGDYDGDGNPDLWVANYEMEDHSLYHNEGGGVFTHATVLTGLGGVGRPQVGFGTGFADFDLDGWLDLFVINGHVLYETGQSSYLQAPFLFHNEANPRGRRFRDVTRERGGDWFRGKYPGRGAAVGDLDNDGDLDLVVVHQNEPPSILLNGTQPADWVRLELRGTTQEPGAVGATVTYRFQDRLLVRHMRSGAGYLSQSDQRILLPVEGSSSGNSTAKDSPKAQQSGLEVTVRWLTGKKERFAKLLSRQTNRLVEGQGEPQ